MIDSISAERYVAGTLSDAELAEFEAAMIERPELAADVNVRRRIKAGLSLLEERQELAPLLQPENSKARYLRYAAAAAVIVVVIGLWSIWRPGPAPSTQAMLTKAEIGTSKVAASFMLVRTRSADVPVFNVRRDEGLVRLQILVDEVSAPPFTASIGPEAVEVAQLNDGFAEIYVDPRRLGSGSYNLSLTPISGTEQTFAFTLNVVP